MIKSDENVNVLIALVRNGNCLLTGFGLHVFGRPNIYMVIGISRVGSHLDSYHQHTFSRMIRACGVTFDWLEVCRGLHISCCHLGSCIGEYDPGYRRSEEVEVTFSRSSSYAQEKRPRYIPQRYRRQLEQTQHMHQRISDQT
jgi:hypothetical protein